MLPYSVPRSFAVVTIAASLLCIAFSGCIAEHDTTLQVSGKVTYQGEPVPSGFIVFEPDSERGNRGPGVGTVIQDGRYSTTYGKGILGGAYVVKISGDDGQASVNEIGEELTGNPIFDLKVVEVDFPRERTTYDFDLSAENTER